MLSFGMALTLVRGTVRIKTAPPQINSESQSRFEAVQKKIFSKFVKIFVAKHINLNLLFLSWFFLG